MKHKQSGAEITVMFTDLVGYSKMMNKDETAALSKLRIFTNRLEELVKSYQGEIIQFYGDAALVTFQKTDNAVLAAQNLVSDLKNKSIPVRVGLSRGPVVYEKENVFGHTVNVAARLEAMGSPGSILCSEEVKQDGRLETENISFHNIGFFKLKNIKAPLRVYALSGENITVPELKHIETKIATKVRSPQKSISRLLIPLFGLVLLVAAGLLIKNKKFSNSTEKKTAALSETSLAILPFSNLSSEESNAYFGDGMMEDILNRLSEINDLKVISRTSVQRYRSTDKTLPEIAEELNVVFILEGSVRRFENRIRVMVNLIKAQDDQQIWSESYDRIIDDIFAIQSEIASKIGERLQLSLLPEENLKIQSKPDYDTKAYEFFLQGRDYFNEYKTGRIAENLLLSQQLFKKALAIDQKMAPAWAYLGSSHMLLHTHLGEGETHVDTAWIQTNKSVQLDPNLSMGYLFRSEIRELRKDRDEMESDLKMALSIAPNSTEILKATGNYYAYEAKEVHKSLPYYKRAILLEPFNDRPLLSTSYVYRRVGDFTKAKDYLRRAIILDPDRISNYMRMADINILEDSLAVARENAATMLKINPDYIWAKHIHAEAHAFDGLYKQAEPIYRSIQAEVNKKNYTESFATPPYRHRLGYVLWQLGRKEEANKLFDESIEKNLKVINSAIDNLGGARYDLAAVYAFRGNKEESIKWLNRIFEDNSWFDHNYTSIDPLFNSIKKEKEFISIINEQKNKYEEEKTKVLQIEQLDEAQ